MRSAVVWKTNHTGPRGQASAHGHHDRLGGTGRKWRAGGHLRGVGADPPMFPLLNEKCDFFVPPQVVLGGIFKEKVIPKIVY